MSDGASDGYRSAREHEARQKSIDDFFGLVISRVTGTKTNARDFRGAFEMFDAHRYADSIVRDRIREDRGKRWEAFTALLNDASGMTTDTAHAKSWTQILALAMRFATPDMVKNLKAVSPFRAYRIALYVPNGTGYHGRIAPSLLGDLEGALDALVGMHRPDVYAAIVDDPDRAVVGLSRGEGKDTENLEPERGKLRFLAVKEP